MCLLLYSEMMPYFPSGGERLLSLQIAVRCSLAGRRFGIATFWMKVSPSHSLHWTASSFRIEAGPSTARRPRARPRAALW